MKDMKDQKSEKDEKEIHDFLSRFDAIADTFEKTSEVKITKEPIKQDPYRNNMTDVQNRQGMQDRQIYENQTPAPGASVPQSRLERLQKSKGKSGLSSVKENLSNTYFSKAEEANADHTPGQSRMRSEPTYTNSQLSKNKNMPIDESEGTMTRKKEKNKNKITKKKVMLTILVGFIALGIACLVLLATIIFTAPPINSESIYSYLSENSTLYDDEGNAMDNLVSKNGLRTNVTYRDLPSNLTNAFVSIEDKTFWEHNGFNFIRILGAIKESIFTGDDIGGTSTITQQLARNIYLSEIKSERSLTRKLKEAYYTILLEKHLSKEQILEAYLNTISLGFNTNGVQAASQAYFSKNVSDLTLAECASLASLPQAPGRTALIKIVNLEEIEKDNPNILFSNDQFAYVYNDSFLDRKNLVLFNMKEQGKISDSEYNEALAYDMRASMKPGEDTTRDTTSYFTDYVVEDVIKGLMEDFNKTEDEATYMLYNGGLKIYTTMNKNMQEIVETEFKSNSNFPSPINLRRDSANNLIDSKGNIMLYDYNNFFDSNGIFTLTPDEYRVKSDGSLVILNGKRLHLYPTTVNGSADCSIEFKDMYIREDGILYGIKGGVIQIPQKYKTIDSDGNCVISPDLNLENPGFLQFGGNGLTIASDKYSLKQRAVQPQASMVILDYKEGNIKAMVGGRGVEGRMLFNRATEPRQPGSSMKPIGAYGPALQASVDQLNGGPAAVTDKSQVYGSYWTAASAINDAPVKLPSGKLWPKNWYTGYKGLTRMRVAIEQSVNTCAVKTFNDIGAKRSIEFAKNLGITSIIESGSPNDLNPAAMALGGMTYGVSPLEMTAAYGAFGNEGLYVSPSSYTKVTNRKDEVILEAKHETVQAMDKGVAYIMTDMLKSAVNVGIAGNASLPNQPVAGKTGTTNDNYDAWFVGYTPQFAGAVWIGNDVNLELNQGSVAATKVWNRVMKKVHSGIPAGKFVKPDNVISASVDSFDGYLPSHGSVTELFVKGTQPKSYFKGRYPSGASAPKKEEPTDETATTDAITPPDGILPPDTNSGEETIPPVVDSGGTPPPPPPIDSGGETVPPVTPDAPPSWINQ